MIGLGFNVGLTKNKIMKLHQLKTEFGSQITEIAKRRNIENIRVFGSVARGDSGEKSDVDFLVHLCPQASLLDLSGFNLDLQDLLRCKVDVLSDNSIHHSIREKIFAEVVSL